MYLCNRFRIDIPAVSIIVLTMSRKSASLAKNTAASILAAIALLAFPFRAAAADGDLNSEAIDTTALTGNWVSQLIKTGFHINDPRINYPAHHDGPPSPDSPSRFTIGATAHSTITNQPL